jgi:hypothetical protein
MAGRPRGVVASDDALTVVFILKTYLQWSDRRIARLIGPIGTAALALPDSTGSNFNNRTGTSFARSTEANLSTEGS